jgi:acyl dehydratase
MDPDLHRRTLRRCARTILVGCALVAVEIDLAPRHGPFVGTLDPAAIDQYAAATNDTSPRVASGAAVPATFPVILIFDAQWAANAAVPKSVYESGRNGVHGEHDVLLHRPLVPGEALETFSEPYAVRNTRAGVRVVLHMEQFGADGVLAVEHWWTIFFPGCDQLVDVGPEPPDHAFPDAAREHPVGSVTQHVDLETPARYAEVSNDWSAHHFELAAARGAGVDFLFAHGLCTMAMCTHAAVGMVADGDPSRVRRVAVRFASPTRLDEDLTVDVYDARDSIGPGVYAFEATCAGAAVITHGRLELFS